MIAAQSQAERAFDPVIEWLEHFEELEDPRQEREGCVSSGRDAAAVPFGGAGGCR